MPTEEQFIEACTAYRAIPGVGMDGLKQLLQSVANVTWAKEVPANKRQDVIEAIKKASDSAALQRGVEHPRSFEGIAARAYERWNSAKPKEPCP